MRSLLYCLFVILCCVSCHDSISLDQIKGQSALVVYAFPSEGDTIEIRVSATRPLRGKGEKLSLTNVRCTTNGRNDIIVASELSDSVAVYYAIGNHRGGDSITIMVSDATLPTTTASTRIPNHVCIEEVSIDSTLYKGNPYTRLQLAFCDDANADYYAVRMVGKRGAYGKKEYAELETATEPVFNHYSSPDIEYNSWNDYYQYMYLFDDFSIRDRYSVLHLSTLEKRWIESYKAQLYVLSPEYYNMLRSLNDARNNDPGAYGLSFMFPTFTNVQGGYGCVAGYSLQETDWLK